MWKLETIKDVLACLQSLAIALSIPVAGYWAYSTYWGKLESDRARVEYEKLKVEIEKTKADYEKALRETRGRQVVNVRINAKQIMIPEDPGRHLSASIEITNSGTTEESFFWKDCEFTAARILVAKTGDVVRDTCLATQVDPLEKNLLIRILPGEIESALFLARVEKPGLYLLGVAIKPRRQGETEPISGKVHEAAYWLATAHLIVE